jgi:hypothetical protein
VSHGNSSCHVVWFVARWKWSGAKNGWPVLSCNWITTGLIIWNVRNLDSGEGVVF